MIKIEHPFMGSSISIKIISNMYLLLNILSFIFCWTEKNHVFRNKILYDNVFSVDIFIIFKKFNARWHDGAVVGTVTLPSNICVFYFISTGSLRQWRLVDLYLDICPVLGGQCSAAVSQQEGPGFDP